MTDRKQLYEGYLAATATLVMWACFSLVSRMAGKSPLTPYDVFALRLITAGVVLLPFIGSMPKDAWRDGRLWLLTFLCSVLYCPLAYAGFKYAPASHGAILLSGMQPFLVTFVAWFIAGTRPNAMRCLGLVLIAVGVACAAMPYFSDWSSAMVFGDLLIFTSSVLWAFYAVLGSRWGYSPWVQTRAVAFGSSLVYLPIYFLWLPKALSEATMTMIAIQGFFQGIVATVLAMLAYLRAIKLLGPERASAFLALVPIVIGVVAVPLLDEPLTGWLASGIVFVSLGSYVASRYGSARLRS
ncbi:DMT family transporter [Propionivibrio soli]|uniref:DMT family transporter n=1 Tax=Propionivibrio soli TaxID=2976531 RepID=UPI0021E797FE|nr:DMT family transporter [Propionivibrio soli]